MIVETHDLQPTRRPARPGWFTAATVAVVVLTLAIGGVVGAYLVNGRNAGSSELATWAPADAAMYAEFDFSLPGRQHDNAAAFLDHWSGVDPERILGDEFGRLVDGLLADAGAPLSYTRDVAPWVTGQVAVVASAWPAPTGMAMGLGMGGEVPEMGFVIGSRDAALATAFLDRMRNFAAADGVSFSSSTHGDATVWSVDVPPNVDAQVQNAEGAYAVTDDAVVVATGADEVGRLLDTHAGTASLATNPELQRLAAVLPADRIGMMAMDPRAAISSTIAAAGTSSPDLAAALAPFLDAVPELTVASFSVESDRLVTTSAMPAREHGFGSPFLSEPLAERIPAGTLFYAGTPAFGETVGYVVDILRASTAGPMTGPMVDDAVAAFEAETGVAIDDLFDWADDAAVYVTWDGLQPAGSVVMLTADPAAAREQVEQLVDAAERTAAGGLTVERQDDVTRLVGAGTPGFEIGYADDAVTFSVGTGSATNLAAIEPASSLGGDHRFTAAVDAVAGTPESTAAWVDLAGIVDAVAAAMGAANDPTALMVLANLDPLDHVVGASHDTDGITVSRLDLVVR